MPPLVCPSPVILDQSFPRSREELSQVVAALGELQRLVDEDHVYIILTTVLEDLVDNFDWSRTEIHPILVDVHRLIQAWALGTSNHVAKCSVQHIADYAPHPVPNSCSDEDGLIQFWSDEVGRLLSLHDKISPARFFIGIACPSAFAGEDASAYPASVTSRRFPIVGPSDLASLDDAYEWETPRDIHQRPVTFSSARRNIHLLGASEVKNPSAGGSHYIVKFRGARSWTLDRNDDPVPDTYLDQLVPITQYPLNVVRCALIEGYLPPAKLRLPAYPESE